MAQNQPEAVDTPTPDTLNDERAHRMSKRAALYAAGQNPYPEHSEVEDHVADIERTYAELEAGVDHRRRGEDWRSCGGQARPGQDRLCGGAR